MSNWRTVMLTKPLVAVLVIAGVAASLGLAQPGSPALPKKPGLPAKPPAKKQLMLPDIFKDEKTRKAMGLDKLNAEEQQRLAEGIANVAEQVARKSSERSVLGEDASKKMRSEGWDEVEVVGVATVKGDRFSLDREVLVVRVLGKKQYYGSGFRDELNRFDKANLRSGPHWGKDMFRSLTLIGLDGMEVELKKVDIDNLP